MPRQDAFVSFLLILACGPAADPPSDEGSSSTGPGEVETSRSGSSSGSPTQATTSGAESSSSTSGAESSSSASADASSSGDTTSGRPPAICECIARIEPLLVPGCELDEVCEPIEMACPKANPADCEFEDLTVVDPTLLECHRDALVEGTPSVLRWALPYLPDPGVRGQRVWLQILGDGTTLQWQELWGNGLYTFSPSIAAALRPPADYAACSSRSTPEATLACLYETGEELATCSDAHSFPFR